MQVNNHFSTPIFIFAVEDATALNVALIKDIKRIQLATEGVQISNQKGWHSKSDFFKRDEESFKKLATSILNGIKDATQKIGPKFELDKVHTHVEGWINVNPQGAFNTPHDHPGFVWSGCYYVQVPHSTKNRSGMIEFLDPRTNITVSGLPNTPVFSSKVQGKPKAGQFFIFPSYLMHWVYPNEEEEERISIAFNVRFVPR